MTNHLPLDDESTATLAAIFYNRWVTLVPNQLVRIDVEGDFRQHEGMTSKEGGRITHGE